MNHLQSPTRILFFTGKGGVGKTTVACATAVQLADRGKRVLLVSTDPASNLDEVLQVTLGNHPRAVPTVPRLSAMNLDPERCAAEYKERIVGPYRKLLPAEVVSRMEEQFSGACTLEIAAFDEFTRLLSDPTLTEDYDHVIFDTAPTGHTLRLLALPAAWSGFMDTNTTGTSCLGPLAGLKDQQQRYRESLAKLSDPLSTTLILVARPETSALREAARTHQELLSLGLFNQQLVLNGTFTAEDRTDGIAIALESRGEAALKAMPESLASLPRCSIPLQSSGVLGLESLRRIGTVTPTPAPKSEVSTDDADVMPDYTAMIPLARIVDDLAKAGHGVILTMGKGGVGKTTVAAMIALALAERGFPVHLSTTDPAAHLTETMSTNRYPNLTMSRIDSIAETQRYREEVIQTVGSQLDPQAKALLDEDLRSPCTEEIAVFRAFAEAVAQGDDRFVVLDTAPTGHTILLLDAAQAYHREVSRQATNLPESVSRLLPRLRDPDFTRILIVTLPEATPVHEAAALQRDLRRAGIEPYGWVMNQCFSLLEVTDPILVGRKRHEWPFIREVLTRYTHRLSMLPWKTKVPVGQQALLELLSEPATQACHN